MTIIDARRPEVAAGAWDQLRELTPATAQRVFRVLMHAFARPGTIHRVPLDELPEGVPAATLPLLALADIMTPIGALRSAAGDSDDAIEAVAAINRIVGARLVEASAARYALAFSESSQLAELSPGSHWSPEDGTTLVQRVTAIRAEGIAGRWRLTGPGIPAHAPVEVAVTGLSDRFVPARAELVRDYPAGVDAVVISDDGTLFALPRTTRIEVI